MHLTLDNVELRGRDIIDEIENCVHGKKPDLKRAQNLLRLYLRTEAGIKDGTMAEAIFELSKGAAPNTQAAVVVLRSLSIAGLIRESSAGITSSVVTFCESALPDITRFLKVSPKSQNYEKFAIYATAHAAVQAILAPVSTPYGDIHAVLAAQKPILGGLSHSFARQYCEPYHIKEIKTSIEAIFGKLKRLPMYETTLLTDVQACSDALRNTRLEFADKRNFLVVDFFQTFLNTCEHAVHEFVQSLRGRFEASIVWGGRTGGELQKRYPLHEEEKQVQITVPFRNAGPGIATNVRVNVTADDDKSVLGSELIVIGNVIPGEFSVVIDLMIVERAESIKLTLIMEWGEIGSAVLKSDIFSISVIAQASDIDWPSLEYRSPYSTGIAEGNQFFGRGAQVKQVASKLLRRPMESCYITGQKRVGKTSLAIAAANFAEANNTDGTIHVHNVLWGAIAHADPSTSIRQLGESIEEFILFTLPHGSISEKGDYCGSLSKLMRVFEVAAKSVPANRYVIILDEFDEIHPELFLQGNLAETFFANLRALSRCKNVCLILVGGENMPFIMDRQGQKLNNFSRINLSYFSRTTEWNDFVSIVRIPTEGILNWHDDALSEIFNVTNGNPYFTKIACASVLRAAVNARDADITTLEVSQAIEAEVSSLGANSFSHLWQDGIPKPVGEREPDVLRRMRTLVAIARCCRQSYNLNASEIAASKSSAMISDTEIYAVLNDLVRREVLLETPKRYEFNLPIFRSWLTDVGVSQLVADALNEELANAALAEENQALVRSDEVVELAKSWPTYQGRRIGTDDIRAWYQQVESLRDQRILFELLKRTRVFSEAQVRERLKTAHSMLRSDFPEFVIRQRRQRRYDAVLTYIDGPAKSGASYALMYAEENSIAAECVIARHGFSAEFVLHAKKHGVPAVLIIMDDIAATGSSLVANINRFVAENATLVKNLKIRIITLLATKTGKNAIELALQDEMYSGLDIQFRTCEILPEQALAFPKHLDVWLDGDMRDRAKALCENLGARIYKNNPLGYGNLGLLVVFPTSVPNNTLPILHSSARTTSINPWHPLFPRMVN